MGFGGRGEEFLVKSLAPFPKVLHQLLIQVQVGLGAFGPGEVLGHGVLHDPGPEFLVFIGPQRLIDGLQEGVRGVVAEDEAGARFLGVCPPGRRYPPGRRFPGRWGWCRTSWSTLVEAAGVEARRHENRSAPASMRWASLLSKATSTPSLPSDLGGPRPASHAEIFATRPCRRPAGPP